MSKDETQFDALSLFAEERGIYLTDQQLSYCRGVLRYNDSVRAAKDAGYENAEQVADHLYLQYRELLEEWREDKKADYYLVIDTYRAAACNAVTRKYHQGFFIEEVADLKGRVGAAKELSNLLGFDAPKEVKNTVVATMGASPELMKKVEEITAGLKERDVKD